MPFEYILPATVAGAWGALTAWLVWRGNRGPREASVLVSQATALREAWDRIEEQQADIEQLIQDKERLERQVGRLQMRLDQYERR